MSVVVLVLMIGTVVVVAGLLAAMFVKDKPIYGAMSLCVLLGPGTVLAILYNVFGA